MHNALVRAGMARFRPVFLTATTTVLGLVPMAMGLSIDFRTMTVSTGTQSTQWWGPMAVAVIFGLTFATVLTLVMVPTMYSILEDFRGLPRRVLALVARARPSESRERHRAPGAAIAEPGE
jgi:multidrug efflux pump subunit AcrB